MHPVYHGGESGNLSCHGISKIFDLVQGHDVIDQSDPERFTGRNDIGGEQEFHSLGMADEAYHAPHLAITYGETQAGNGDPKTGIVGGNADVTGSAQFTPAADTGAHDKTDSGLANRLSHIHSCVKSSVVQRRFGSVIAVRLELADFRPRRKRLLAGTTQDDDAHLWVLLDINKQAL